MPVKIKTLADAYDLEKAKIFANTYGVENVTKNIDEALNDPEINIVDICIPPMFHIYITIKALKTAKNVICEKC